MKRVLALLLTMTIACLAQAVPSTHDAESQFYRDSLKAIQNADDTYRDYDDFYQKLVKQEKMLPDSEHTGPSTQNPSTNPMSPLQ